MSDESNTNEPTAEQTEPEQRPGDEAPTGWHIYDGREVIVQLFDPYIMSVDPQQGPMGSPILQGTFKITKGAGGNGALLFVLHSRQDTHDAFITLQPGDVKHLTYLEQREQPRVVTP